MILQSISHGCFRTRRVSGFSVGLLLAWLAILAIPALAQTNYFVSGQPDGIELLAPPPAPGSAEEAADLDSVRAVFKGRTPELEARANKSAALSMFLFERAIGPCFQRGKLPKTEALFQNVLRSIGDAIDYPKDHWQRKRPYVLDESLSLGKPEKSYSYPSGHSTRGTVYSLMFAEIFPEKREAILEIGREIGWDRVLIGKHFPTDVNAGRVLGKAIFRALKANPDFQRDLAAAKAEASELCAVGAK